MAKGFPFNYNKHYVKENLEEPETEPEQVVYEHEHEHEPIIKNECQLCEEYKKTIEFERKVLLILAGGIVVKMLLDSVVKKNVN